MKTALIIGIDSTIGTFLHKELLVAGWQVFGTTRRKEQVQEQVFYLDLLHSVDFNFDLTIDVVFLCAGITKIITCRDYPRYCQIINVDAQVKVAEHFFNKGTHIVFLSTSAVFNGKKPGYEINNETCPVTVYGESKVAAEKKLSNLSKNIAIVRLTKVFTPDYPLIKQWIKELKNNRIIEPFHDYYVCPLSIKMVTSCLRKIAERKLGGVIHLSGECDASYQTVAEHLANSMGVSSSLIKSKSALDSGILITEIPRYTSLNMMESKKLFNISDTSLSTTLNNLYCE